MPYCASTHFRHQGFPCWGNFVKATGTVDHVGAANAEFNKCGCHQVQKFRRKNAKNVEFRGCGIGERSEQVKDRAFANLLASRDGMTCGGMGRGSEKKSDSQLANGLTGMFQGEVDTHTERFEHICRAAARTYRPVAVLRHTSTSRGSDEGGGSGNVECSGAVATGAAGVNEVVRASFSGNKYGSSVAPHDTGKSAQFGRMDLSAVQSFEQTNNVGSRDPASEEFLHEEFGFRAGEGREAFRFGDQRETFVHSTRFRKDCATLPEMLVSSKL